MNNDSVRNRASRLHFGLLIIIFIFFFLLILPIFLIIKETLILWDFVNCILIALGISSIIWLIITLFFLFIINKKEEVIFPTHFQFFDEGIMISNGKYHYDTLKWNEITSIDSRLFGLAVLIKLNRKVNFQGFERIGSKMGDVILIHYNKEIFSWWEAKKPDIVPLRVERPIPFFTMKYNQYNDEIFSYENELFMDRVMSFGIIFFIQPIFLLITIVFGSLPIIIIHVGIILGSLFLFTYIISKVPRKIIIKNDRIELKYLRGIVTYYFGDYDFFYYDNASLILFKNRIKIKEIIFRNEGIEKDLDYIYHFFS